MDLFDVLRALAALVFVLGLIFSAAWVARARGWAGAVSTVSNQRKLRVKERLMLGPRHTAVLVEACGEEYLLCLGPGGQDIVTLPRQDAAGIQPNIAVIEGGK